MEHRNSVLGLLAVAALALCANAGYTRGCVKHCPYGQVLDSGSCKCVPNRVLVDPVPQCPLLRCVTGPFPCKEYKKDARGCNTCQCLDRCFRSRCPRRCRGGTENYVDDKGCNACRCKQQQQKSVCSKQVRCALYCQHGYVTDTNGCDTCQCKPAPCGSGCKIACPYGRVTNFNGCELCECKPKPQCGTICANNCNYGRSLDSYGCPTCQCLSG